MKEPKKKLLVFHSSLAPYRIDFWNSLNEVYELHLYFLYPNVPDQQFNQQELRNQLQLKCNYFKSGFSIGPRAFRWGFLPIIRRIKPDIIFSFEYSQTTVSLFLIKKIFGFNYSLYTMCDDSLHIAETCKGLRKIFRNYLVEKIDGLIVVNKKVAAWYESKYKLKNKCIYFPIVAKETEFRLRLSDAIPLSNLYLSKYNLIGKKCILFVGRLVTVKGIDRLIKAFAKISEANPDSILVLVGSGNKETMLKKQVNESGLQNNVLFAGRYESEKLIAWYNIGQIFVLSSHYEPFGAVVNEALLSGITVLCSKNAGASDLIVPDVNGTIFDPYDIDSLSNLLNKELKITNRIEPLQLIRTSKMENSYSGYFNVFK